MIDANVPILGKKPEQSDVAQKIILEKVALDTFEQMIAFMTDNSEFADRTVKAIKEMPPRLHGIAMRYTWDTLRGKAGMGPLTDWAAYNMTAPLIVVPVTSGEVIEDAAG